MSSIAQVHVRRENVTRLETFVDAAFAFAATMLVISVGNVPHSLNEFFEALWHIPSFVFCFVLILLFWSAHNQFNRRFGVEDATTTFYSLALVLTVLVFVYPLRVVIGFGCWFLTGGFLPAEIAVPPGGITLGQLEGAFIVYGIGFSILCAIVCLLNRHALSLTQSLRLREDEIVEAKIEIRRFSINLIVSLLSIAAAVGILLTGSNKEWIVGLPGAVYGLLAIVVPINARWVRTVRAAANPVAV